MGQMAPPPIGMATTGIPEDKSTAAQKKASLKPEKGKKAMPTQDKMAEVAMKAILKELKGVDPALLSYPPIARSFAVLERNFRYKWQEIHKDLRKAD